MVGFQEEAEMDKKGGFLVSLVKTIKREQNLVEERMHLKELNRDVGPHAPHVKLTRGGKENELGNNSKRNGLSKSNARFTIKY